MKLSEILFDKNLNDSARIMYHYLYFTSDENGYLEQKVKKIASDIGWNSSKVSSSVKMLVDYNYITYKNIVNCANEYTVIDKSESAMYPKDTKRYLIVDEVITDRNEMTKMLGRMVYECRQQSHSIREKDIKFKRFNENGDLKRLELK